MFPPTRLFESIPPFFDVLSLDLGVDQPKGPLPSGYPDDFIAGTALHFSEGLWRQTSGVGCYYEVIKLQ